MRRTIFWGLLLTTFLSGPSLLAGPRPLSAREWATVYRQTPYWLWGSAQDKKKVRMYWSRQELLDRSLTRQQAARLLALLQRGSPFLTDRRKARQALQVPSTVKGENSKVLFQLAGTYRPGRGPAGLLIVLHDGPQGTWPKAEEAALKEFGHFNYAANSKDLCTAAPAIKAINSDPSGSKIVFGLIEQLSRRHNIDRNRIWLAGHGSGATQAFALSLAWADRFAGVSAINCSDDLDLPLENAWNVPVYHVLGRKDKPQFVAAARRNAMRLEKVVVALQAVERDAGREVYPLECAKAVAWMTGKPRKFWSKTVRWTPAKQRTTTGFYWVETSSNSSPFQVRATGNEIEITGSQVTGLLVSDELVNLDNPIHVLRGGKTLNNGKVVRSLKTMLQWIEQTGDFSSVPMARLALR